MGKVFFAVFIFFLIINIILIKKRKIEFKYSMIFIFSYIIFMILLFSEKLNKYFAYCTGIMYVPVFVFVIGMVISFLAILYLMTVISDINNKVTKLIQQNAILNDKINERLK